MVRLKQRLHPNTMFNMQDENLIKYISRRLLLKKEVASLLEIRKYLKTEYKETLDESGLWNAKVTINLRKTILESAAMENMVPLFFSIVAIIVSIIMAPDIEHLSLNDVATSVLYIAMCLMLLSKLYIWVMNIRTREIAFCVLIIDVIEEIQTENYGIKKCPKCQGGMLKSEERGKFL